MGVYAPFAPWQRPRIIIIIIYLFIYIFITQHIKYIQLQWVKIEIKVSHKSHENVHVITECALLMNTNKQT